jgi:hypothetical protein
MKQGIKAAGAAAAVAALVLAAPVLADKGLGDLYNLKYEAYGISDTHVSDNGSVAVDVQDIATINCGGCDTQWLGAGLIFHARNLTKEPVCAAFVFDRIDKQDYQLNYWGTGNIYYLKSRKSASKIGGLYTVNGGDERNVNLSYSWSIHTWTPIAKNKCGADPYA